MARRPHRRRRSGPGTSCRQPRKRTWMPPASAWARSGRSSGPVPTRAITGHGSRPCHRAAAVSRVAKPFWGASLPTASTTGRPAPPRLARAAATAVPPGGPAAGAGTWAMPTLAAPRRRIRSARSPDTQATASARRATIRSSSAYTAPAGPPPGGALCTVTARGMRRPRAAGSSASAASAPARRPWACTTSGRARASSERSRSTAARSRAGRGRSPTSTGTKPTRPGKYSSPAPAGPYTVTVLPWAAHPSASIATCSPVPPATVPTT